MPDREKVIEMLSELLAGRKVEDEFVTVPLTVVRDALALLEEKDNESLKLNSCPFCGGIPVYVSGYVKKDDDGDMLLGAYVQCGECGARIDSCFSANALGVFVGYEIDMIRKKVIEAWNKRTCNNAYVQLNP